MIKGLFIFLWYKADRGCLMSGPSCFEESQPEPSPRTAKVASRPKLYSPPYRFVPGALAAGLTISFLDKQLSVSGMFFANCGLYGFAIGGRF